MEPSKSYRSLAKHDLPQFYLLVALYFVQGIPVGLAFGTIPFLLKSMVKETSFTSLGVFSIATYPYSLKILWSPIIDSLYSKKIGRRRSWIIPIQLASGLMLYILGHCISKGYIFSGVDAAFHPEQTVESMRTVKISTLTWYFGSLVFLCATQDIAVDGWALTILSKRSLSYASTAQTVGLNMGYFLSFTVFLSLNSGEFVNKYFRKIPQKFGWISLGGYMKFAGFVYVIVTIYVGFCTTENPFISNKKTGILPYHIDTSEDIHIEEKKDDDLYIETNGDEEDGFSDRTRSLGFIYKCFFKVLKLKSVRTLTFIHLISKIAFQCNEGATNLKLLEQGFKREDLAVTVLIDVPFEIIFGYYVAKWSSDSENERHHHSDTEAHKNTKSPVRFRKWIKWFVGDAGVLTPWLWGYLGRLLSAILGSYVIHQFPKNGELTKGYFFLIIIQHLLGSFMATVQFVGISAFHTRIADPVLGGTYMTLLNTLSNFGGTWPRFFVMSMINYFTIYECELPNSEERNLVFKGGNMEVCTNGLHGEVKIIRDGYYVTNALCVVLGVILYFCYLKRKAQQLQTLPISAWRCKT
ncbi:uncharacterized protein NDAI_0F01820 [Naumovozyma dairenensis CBS 421]|uniref:Acetyl-CoA transporter n=1 Tax=Naumovozyma dairenensis (strain ATCC 10597 / BCRC 20456 / CBS 421 / NBRC 0211 / NRRL Y-12639) TaxID=1071378 RepID=G0WCJ0_NAUDC|nr:hypothetical protein NDAI_0F01820 [Naumovozyma dairenensis CBS 421]CCD25501.1 hypothetical protein NDAI_0F01820 [Naumovozyma dairenensis CBS 421]